MSQPSSGRSRVWPWVVLAATFCYHAWGTARLFPTWGSVTDDAPVVMVDHAIHLYHGAIGSRCLLGQGRTWGYDPFFMAGYPESPVWDSSSNLSIAFQAAAGGGYHPGAYKVGLVVAALLAWLAVPAGARASGLGISEAAAAGVLAAGVFWACAPAMFWRTGMFAFVTASAWFPLILGVALSFGRMPGPGRWALLAASGAAWLFAHVTAPVLAVAAAPGFVLTHVGKARRRSLAAGVGAAVLAAAVNAFWLTALWTFRDIRAPLGFFMASDDPFFLWNFATTNRIDGAIGLALTALGAGGLLAWWLEPAGAGRARASTFGSAAVLLLALTAFGGLSTVTRTLEPFRFLATLDFLLAVPAASLLVRAAGWIAWLGGGGIRGALAATAAGCLSLIAAGFASPETFRFAVPALFEYRPLAVGIRPADRALLALLGTETDGSARVLFEDQLRLFERTDPESTHWTPLLPELLGRAGRPRAFIGGLYQTAFIAHHRAAAFGDYDLGGRRVDAWSSAERLAYFERYNVGWAVCWSPLSRFVFDNEPAAKVVKTVTRPASPGREVMPDETQWRAIAARAGPRVADRYLKEGVTRYALYRIDRPRSYMLEGSGSVAAFDVDRVELTGLLPDAATGFVTLSLHWLDEWRAEPPVPLSPRRVEGDPVPFVRLKLRGPLKRLILSNGRTTPGGR